MITVEKIAELIEVDKDQIDSNTEKLCEWIIKQGGLNEIISTVYEFEHESDSSMESNRAHDAINISQIRNINGLDYEIQASLVGELLTLKTTSESTVFYKSYTTKEIKRIYGIDEEISVIINELEIENGEIFLSSEKNH